MNVATDPWIPVTDLQGAHLLISLKDALTNGAQYTDLAVRPHERVALMRLLLCVAHAALDGPKNYDDWMAVPSTLPAAIDAYFKKWLSYFNLLDPEKPWMQVAGLSKYPDKPTDPANVAEWTPVSKLNFACASGNNTTIFDHEGTNEERAIPLPETVISLLTFQCFSPGGLISQVFWNGQHSGKSSKDGPCVASSMIHAMIRGNNMQNTLYWNLLTYETINSKYSKFPIGRPVWEKLPSSPDDHEAIQNATQSFLGRLTPLTRIVRFNQAATHMLLGDGLIYPSFADGGPVEPTATVITRNKGTKEERALLPFRPDKGYWRELNSIIVKREYEKNGGPLSLWALPDTDSCDLLICALARDQATIVDTKESVFHIPSIMRSPEGTASYEHQVQYAEQLASRLGWAIETYRKEIDGSWEGRLKGAGAGKRELQNKLRGSATRYYWTGVEKVLPLLFVYIESIETDQKETRQKQWQDKLFGLACEAYRQSCGQSTSRQLKAFNAGWKNLTSYIPDSSDEKSSEEE